MIEDALSKIDDHSKNHISFLGNIGKTEGGIIGHNSSTSLHRSIIPLHAEMDCIKKLSYKMCKMRTRYCDVDLICLKVKKNGSLGNSQPCYHCATELYKHKKIRVRRVYFSLENGTIEKYNFKEWYCDTTHYISSGWNRKSQLRKRAHGSKINKK